MAKAYDASDYAGIESKSLKAYYGYEETVGDGDDEEWCFVARRRINDEWVEFLRIPRPKLGVTDTDGGDECAAYLLKGLAIMFDQYELKHNRST